MAGYQRLDTAITQSLVEDQPHSGNAVRHTNKAAIEAQQIRARGLSFKGLHTSKQISDVAVKFGSSLTGEHVTAEERKYLVKKKPAQCVELFSSLLTNFRATESLQAILTLLVDLTEIHEVCTIIVTHPGGSHILQMLLTVLGRSDPYCGAQACLAFGNLASCSHEVLDGDQLNQYLSWTISQLRYNNEYVESISKALMSFLKRPVYRCPFYEANGVKPILDTLDHKISFQLQYELICCLWLISFDRDLVTNLKDDPVAIAVLCDVLRTTNRPKVQRVIMAAFRNLLEKPDQDISDHFASQMIHFKAFPVLKVLVSKSLDDTDFEQDVEMLHDKLKLSLQDLSSFDEYAAEVRSGRLEWSPVHRSDKFWRENIMMLNERNYEMLRLLVAIIREAQNPTVLAVAAHDLGEYVRYYPRGKRIIDQMGAKELVMSLVQHSNNEVRMQALLSIQKMMVQNWEYLGKQLESRA